MKRISNLLENKKIVEKRNRYYLISLSVIVLALIMALIFGLTTNNAFNLGMDFKGGYTISVNVGANLNDENKDDYIQKINDVIDNYKDADGQNYDINPQILVSGTGDATSLQIRYKTFTDANTMEIINEGLVDALEKEVTKIVPAVVVNGITATVDYSFVVTSYRENFEQKIATVSGVSDLSVEGKTVTFDWEDLGPLDDAEKITKVAELMTISDVFAGSVYTNGQVGATVSQDLLFNALSAILISLVLMLGYIFIRFEFTSAISSIVALVHDLLIMVAFMAIFHVEITSTFIAALITILGYSINNSIIVFDRIRENLKLYAGEPYEDIVNRSISQSFFRCLNTTITTGIMITSIAVVCAIASIWTPDLSQLVVFALPIIIGLLSGFFSALFIAPSTWVALKNKGKGSGRVPKPVSPEANDKTI